MRQAKYAKSIKGNFGYGVGIGIVVTVILSAVVLALISYLVLKGNISEEKSSIYIFTTRLISVLIGGIVGAQICDKKPLPIIATISGGYLLLVLGIGIIAYDGAFQKVLRGIMSIFAGGVIACIIKLKIQKKPQHAVRRKK